MNAKEFLESKNIFHGLGVEEDNTTGRSHKISDLMEEYAELVAGKNSVLQHVMPSFDSPKNWTEDYKHENGNYVCRCSKCKEYFYGHKRRPLCKECGS